MRKTLFQIIEPHQQESFIEEAYDIFMVLAIIVSLIPLTSKSHSGIFIWLDLITTIIFIIDYVPGSSLPIINYRKEGFLSYSILLLS